MAALLPLLAFLLVAGAGGGGGLATAVLGMDDATVPPYSSASEVITYWKTMLPNSPMPSSVAEHLSAFAGNNRKLTFQQGFHGEDDEQKQFQPETQMNGDDGGVSLRWGSQAEKTDGKSTLQLGLHHQGDGERVTFTTKPQIKIKDEKISFGWGPHTSELVMQGQQVDGENDHKITLNWASHKIEGDEKTTLGWGPNTKNNNQKIKDEKISFGWGPHTSELVMQGQQGDEDNDHKTTLNWGSHKIEGDQKTTLGWGQPNTKNKNQKIKEEKISFGWGPHTSELVMQGQQGDEDNDHKTTLNWGSHKIEGDKKATLGWGPNTKNNDVKISHQWGPSMDEDIEEVFGELGHANGGDDKATLRWRSEHQNIASLHQGSDLREGPQHHQVHVAGNDHGKFNPANILFLEAVLTPGTLMASYIEPSVFPAPFLRREIADSIPISTKSFTDVLSMLAPMSLAMASKIWSTLHTCEHPHPLEGEQQACATSLESMVELAASVLGTRDLRAFSSSPDVPAAGFVASPSSKYKVAAVRAVTAPDEEATTMTCHGMTFPYAVFYCHAVNPTRVYEVTLQMSAEEEDGMAAAGKKTMQVLAVCHLDTSQFDPANPFFVARGLKPGDAAVCHFLSRDSVLWAPTALTTTQGNGLVAAQ